MGSTLNAPSRGKVSHGFRMIFPVRRGARPEGQPRALRGTASLRSWLLPRLCGRFLLQLGEQLLEVLPLAERVEGTLGAIILERYGAEAVNGLSQQGHRLDGVGLSLGGRHPRALLPGEARERGV